MPFTNRQQAGSLLADRLEPGDLGRAIVLALPRGGTAVGAPIARRLDVPLDLLLVRKIGVPGCPEVAMGAISDGGHPVVVRNEDVISSARIPDDVFQAAAARALTEIERRSKTYFANRKRCSPRGRVAILVDDGAATGATLKAALEALKLLKPDRIIVALPVAPTSLVEDLRPRVDEFICLEPLGPAGAVGAHYRSFEQLTDASVIELLNSAPSVPGETGGM